jgi:MATE family multidrug resistance protein
MNTADTIMVGPLGGESLAAAGLGSALHYFTIMLCTGVVIGMAPLVSQAYGAGDTLRCRRILVQGLWLSVALAVPVMAVTFFGESIALGLGQEPVVARVAGEYLAALAWGVAPAFLFMAFRQYLEGMGIVTPVMVITFVGLGANVLCNWLLIYGVPGWIPALGVAGSGWATTIVRWLMLVAVVVYVLRHSELRPFHGVRLGLERAVLGRILGLGLPVGGQIGMEVGLFSFTAVMMGWLGALPLGAHQVTLNIAATTFMVALGTSLAGSVRVGQHVGAGRPDGVRRAALGTYLLAGVFMSCCALLFLVVPRGLIGLYTSDPAIVELGSRLLLVAALFQVFDGAQVAGTAILRGAGDTRVSMLLAALGYWVVGLPVGYLLGFHTSLGPVGVWVGLSTGLAAVAVLLALRVRRLVWRGVGAEASVLPSGLSAGAA